MSLKTFETKFVSILKAAGKDLSHVGTWIEDGLKIAAPFVAVEAPSLAPVVSGVESIIENLQAASTAPLSAAAIQQVTTALTVLHTLAPGFVTVNTVANVTKAASAVQDAVNAAPAVLAAAAAVAPAVKS